MTYELRLARQAESHLRRLPRQVQRRMLRRLEHIATNPFGPHTKPLTGYPDDRAARVGGWRIVFSVDEQARRVDVSDIGPRGDIYRRL